MASGGSATAGLRHSFMGPATSDRDPRAKKLMRKASLPSQFADKPKPAAGTKSKKRMSGLFESSSDSGSASSDHEQAPTDRHGYPDARRVKKVDGSSFSAVAAPSTRPQQSMPSRENSANNERKGLFEIDDDAAESDSVEMLRARVKLRQKKKEHEILSLRSELHVALARSSELDEQLTKERKEKDEFAIRMNECQRIIEKRNKQLIKASEKLARLGEQTESQVNELEQQLRAMAAQVETVRATERAALERLRDEFEQKLTQQRVRFESQLEALTLAAAEKMRTKEAEESELLNRIARLEDDVVGATSRIGESNEYQILLKRCEDAEAISRGLRFQLEKTQNEKKFLKQQLDATAAATSTAQKSNASPGYLPSTDLFGEGESTILGGRRSRASSATSVDLSSFEYARSPLQSPRRATAPSSSSSATSKPIDLKVSTGSSEHVHDNATDGDDGDPPSSSPLATSQSDRTESKARPGSGTINFFEKISIKFKRSASSPRNTTPSTKSDDADANAKPGSLGSFSLSSQPQPPQAGTSLMDLPSTSRRKVLSKRPKMYVAKSPSDYEESSDSIFGSDSDSDASSADDDDDQPPPPPPNYVSRSPTHSVELPPVTMPPPPPPPLFGDASDDADSSSLSDDANAKRDDALRRVILPTPMSPPPVIAEPTTTEQPKPAEAPLSSSSSGSDSDNSSGEDEMSYMPHQSKNTAGPTREKSDVKAASASSDSEVEVSRGDGTHRQRVVVDATTTQKSEKQAHGEPRNARRDRSRSSDGDAVSSAAAKVNRMNAYMEARARKRQEKLSKREEREQAESKKREEYEKEWERMAEEERERRRKQQKARRTGKRRPSSTKTVRVSQMRHQMSKHHKDVQGGQDDGAQPKADDSDDDNGPPRPDRRRSDHHSSENESSDDDNTQPQATSDASSPPLPPEPTAADTDLYIRQQARLREHHEMEMKKKQESDEADLVRGQIHRRIEMWAFAKELLHMILTLDQISSNEALKNCQLMVVQSPDPDTLRKAYRNIIRVIHPDKLRNATITEQLEAKELFTVLNQAFEKFKAQQ